MTITRMTFSTGRICSREATSKRVGTDPTFSRRIFSLTNHITEIWFSLRANKIRPKTGLNNKSIYLLLFRDVNHVFQAHEII
jgi:hypothetical protein